MLGQLYETTGDTAATLIAEINDLRRQRNAIILAHNYEYGEIQEI
ncbi:MAG: quinolinate synthase, partial [Chloroflexus aggregans]